MWYRHFSQFVLVFNFISVFVFLIEVFFKILSSQIYEHHSRGFCLWCPAWVVCFFLSERLLLFLGDSVRSCWGCRVLFLASCNLILHGSALGLTATEPFASALISHRQVWNASHFGTIAQVIAIPQLSKSAPQWRVGLLRGLSLRMTDFSKRFLSTLTSGAAHFHTSPPDVARHVPSPHEHKLASGRVHCAHLNPCVQRRERWVSDGVPSSSIP